MGTLKFRRRRTALAAGLATLAMAASLAAAPAQAADKTKYIALGDSYAAGQGAGLYKNDTCYRSANSYSELAAETKAIKLVTNAACSGKTTQEVVATQLRQLNKTTELVTITAGGNNLGFGDIVTNCGTAIFDSAFAAACAAASATAKAKLVSGQLAGEVASMIQSVQAAAPNAKIVVTGYPYLFDPIPAGLADPMSQFIYQATDLADGLNGSIALAAAAIDPSAVRVWLRSTPSCLAPSRAIASRDWWLSQCVRNSTAAQPRVSKACRSSSSLESGLLPLPCAEAAFQVEPISTRGVAASMFMYVVIPITLPGAPVSGSSSRVANGSIEPLSCSARRRSISAAIASGAGTEAYQSFQSSPSRTASTRPSWCAWLSGSSATYWPVRVIGSMRARGGSHR